MQRLNVSTEVYFLLPFIFTVKKITLKHGFVNYVYNLFLGKPYRANVGEMDDPVFLQRKFRQACSWYSFTLDRRDTAWTYSVYICKFPPTIQTPFSFHSFDDNEWFILQQYFGEQDIFVEWLILHVQHYFRTIEAPNSSVLLYTGNRLGEIKF